jgi:hypothetical protein
MSATTATELTQLTAPNQSVEDANGITYAYRRFGNAESDAPPLLFLQHFRGRLNRLAGIAQPVLVANGDKRPHDPRPATRACSPTGCPTRS